MASFSLLFLVVLCSCAFISCVTGSALNCSLYMSDKEIIEAFSYPIGINPSSSDNEKSYAKVDEEGRVIELTLSNLNQVPLSIFCLNKLETLSLQDSSNLIIPGEISLLASSIKTLQMTNISKALVLPSEIFSLTSLMTLSIVDCGLESLSEAIEQLSQVSTLKLNNNRLTSLPIALGKLLSLRTLSIDNNIFLSSVDAVSGSQSLKDLRASNCAIDHLPSNISNLETLVMEKNQLKSLDGVEVISPSKASYYSFKQNQISSIPTSIVFIRTLKKLFLEQNLLTTIPEEIYRMKSLEYLSAPGNKFNMREVKWIEGRFRFRSAQVYV